MTAPEPSMELALAINQSTSAVIMRSPLMTGVEEPPE